MARGDRDVRHTSRTAEERRPEPWASGGVSERSGWLQLSGRDALRSSREQTGTMRSRHLLRIDGFVILWGLLAAGCGEQPIQPPQAPGLTGTGDHMTIGTEMSPPSAISSLPTVLNLRWTGRESSRGRSTAWLGRLVGRAGCQGLDALASADSQEIRRARGDPQRRETGSGRFPSLPMVVGGRKERAYCDANRRVLLGWRP